MYKDKEDKKNVKNILLSMCDVKVFLSCSKTIATEVVGFCTNA